MLSAFLTTFRILKYVIVNSPLVDDELFTIVGVSKKTPALNLGCISYYSIPLLIVRNKIL